MFHVQLESIKSNNKKTGRLGEVVAAEYLKKRGLMVLEMNYTKSFAEIDIVARETDITHFVEVKTVSYDSYSSLEQAVSRATRRPEELVHRRKIKQIHKAVQAWLLENKHEGNFQIDVVAVHLVPRETYAAVDYIENIFLD